MSKDRNDRAKQESVHSSLGHAFKHQDHQLGAKMSVSLQLWYEAIQAEQINPLLAKVNFLEQRLAWLELPAVARWWVMYKRCWLYVFALVNGFFGWDEDEEDEITPTDPDGGEPLPEPQPELASDTAPARDEVAAGHGIIKVVRSAAA